MAYAKYCEVIAKSLIANADSITSEIDKYIAKADDDLKKQLKKEGYTKPKETVKAINSMEEAIADILHNQTDELVDILDQAATDDADWEETNQRVAEMLNADDISEQTQVVAEEIFTAQVPALATAYIKESDGELTISTLRKRTSAWISSWSETLGEFMRLNTHSQISSLIEQTISDGDSIADLSRKILDGGFRNEYYQAKRVAVTEVLRAHSVAREESIQQSPAVEGKEWKHTGAHKIKPRQNHVKMDGQIVPKDEAFTLVGADGNTYYPAFPRDPLLPAGESVNCHCIHRGVVNDDVLGLSLDERKALQQKIIEADDGEWEKELDAKNKSKAGIEVGEQENSKVKYDNKEAVIDRKMVASADYRKRYDALPEKAKVKRKVASNAKKMLRHRSGTEYEDLAYIDSKTGSCMVRDNYNVKKQVLPSRAMKKMVNGADDYTIISVHNHPTSSAPSLSDLCSARDKKYKYGIAAGHNGTIYKYAVHGDLNEPMADGGLDMLDRVKYIEDEGERTKLLDRALSVLKDSGVEMEVL